MANLIFYNGVIHTMTGRRASAVAISGSRFQAVGADEEILALAEKNTTCIDLKGKCLVPGFHDTHCHLLLTGLGYDQLNLRGVSSVEELIAAGREYVEKRQIPAGSWVLGEGFDHNIFPEPVLPDCRALDAISRDHPILLERVCGHVGTASTMALKQIGYDETTRIPGGVLDLDGDGRLTGVLREAALDQFKMRLPKPDLETLKSAIRAAAKTAVRHGVTSVHTDDLEAGTLEDIMRAYRELEEEGALHVRVFEEIQAARMPQLNQFLEKGLRTGDGTDYFKIGNIKLLPDGSLGARTAYMRADYNDDPGNRGVAVYTQEALDEVVLAAHQAGMQIACHAIGDGAVEQCVQAYEKAQATDGRKLRHRIVHCQFADGALIRRMADGGIAADIQPGFQISDYPLLSSRMGERQRYGYCWKSMVDAGVCLGGGSDCPVEPLDPIHGIFCAVNRTDGKTLPKEGWMPEEKLSAEEALKLYTVNGAYLSFEEGQKGIIKEGALADLAVLSADILQVPPEKLMEVNVEMTVVGGTIVFERSKDQGSTS